MDPSAIPGLDLIPEPWRTRLVLAVLAAPMLGRAYHRLRTGGGIVGIVRAVLFGDNAPKP